LKRFDSDASLRSNWWPFRRQ